MSVQMQEHAGLLPVAPAHELFALGPPLFRSDYKIYA